MGESSIVAPAATGTTSTRELAMDVPIQGFATDRDSLF
jgi:hypothetical protein